MLLLFSHFPNNTEFDFGAAFDLCFGNGESSGELGEAGSSSH
jgi:hypothetical protein